MKNQLMAAAAVLALMSASSVAYAGEAADVQALKAQAAELKKQNAALEQRLNAIEAKQTGVSAAQPSDFLAQAKNAGADFLTGEAPLTFYGITLYGNIDAGIGWESAGASFNGAAPQNTANQIGKASNRPYFGAVQGGGAGYNAIGLKGEQALGFEDLKGVFNLSTNFSPLSGQLSNGPASLQQQYGVAQKNQTFSGDSSRAGQAFNNVAYAGVSSKTYGELTFGRQNSLTASTLSAFDPFSGSLLYSATGFSGSWSGGQYTEGTKWDDSLKYTYTYSNFYVSGMVKFSQWGTPQTGGDGNWQVGVGVKDWNNFSAAVSGGHLSGVPKLAANADGGTYPTLLTGTLADQDVIAFGANYKWQAFTFYGGYQFFQLSNPSTTQSGSFSVSNPWSDANGYQVSSLKTTAYGSDSVNSIFWIGTKYAYDPKLDIVAGWYHWNQNQYNAYKSGVAGGVAPTAAQCNAARATRLANCSGTSDVASLAGYYKFTKRLTGYAGLAWSSVSGGLAAQYLVTSVWAPSIGLRYAF